ncbi:unnamed protein product [Nesidiocoris tenuis]|uniref:Gamma-interferon-inducible lysosomal thiol reductase n=1 Tax=Nesidiocoris tenuis TaxID=355587 RepID=A0A6H5GCN5_9HEMI|nr:unnamed protein product [Nesidiocoris tenuis]CAB0000908.1 unnamed protein product [Nesidiocoris tenuis]
MEKIISAAAVSKKLNVDLYYESLCPGCRALITGQLVDVAAALDEYLNINLVPFGNARYQGKTIVCQHGEEECLGNKIHACAIKRLNNQLQQVQFVGCMDKIPSVEDGGKQCSAKFNLEWEDVQSCANGSEGEALHASYGKATLALSPTNPFVPVVAIDGVSISVYCVKLHFNV